MAERRQKKGDLQKQAYGTSGSNLADYREKTAQEAELMRAVEEGEHVVEIATDKIVPSRFQARIIFDEDALNDLSADIKKNGILQPVLVRRIEEPGTGEERYELALGERRWQATQRAGLATIPARIRTLSDLEMLNFGVAENNQRQDFSPYEKALEVAQYQRNAEAAQIKVTQRDLEQVFQRNLGTINEQLKIAQMITRDAIDRAGLMERQVCSLTHAALIRIAKRPHPEIPKKLKEAVRLKEAQEKAREEKRNRKAASDEKAPLHRLDDDERWTRAWERGGFAINVRDPIKEIAPRKASKYLRDLLPGIVGLAQRAANGAGPFHHLEHREGRVLVLGNPETMTPDQRRKAREHLQKAMAALEAE